MGFFKSLAGGIFGSPSKSSSQSGFSQLPPELQAPLTQFGEQLTGAFTDRPAPTISAPEQQAFQQIGAGGAPTSESLQADLAMLMNPFDENVINAINREAQGAGSLVSQQATQAGQQGSNRAFLGASDVEQQRLNEIGRFKQGQFDTSIQNILGPIAGLKQQDIANLLGQGQLERDIPFSDLERFADLIGAIPEGGSTSRSKGARKGTLEMASQAISSREVKNNIVKVGKQNGFNIYHFNYKKDPNTIYEGVMAEEVEETRPDAIVMIDGIKGVNYDKLGLKMKEVI